VPIQYGSKSVTFCRLIRYALMSMQAAPRRRTAMNTRCTLTAARRTLIGALAVSGATWLPCLGTPGAAVADAPSPAPAHIAASWQKHQYSFQYMGFTSTYSCDGLADKLKVLLLAAAGGAGRDAQPPGPGGGGGR